jgi:hypothetical protein
MQHRSARNYVAFVIHRGRRQATEDYPCNPSRLAAGWGLFCRLDPAGGQPKDDEVGPPGIEHRAQLWGVSALASDKSFKGIYEEASNVFLSIGDANPRPDLSAAKRNNIGSRTLTIHTRLPLIEGGQYTSFRKPKCGIPYEKEATSYKA